MKLQGKIRDKIFRKIWDTGDSAYFLSPCLSGLLARYDGRVIGDDLLDIQASGGYLVEEGHSWLADGTAYGEFESDITITGDFTIRIGMKPGATGTVRKLLGADDTQGLLHLLASENLQMYIAGTAYSITSPPIEGSFVLSRTGSVLTLTYLGVEYTRTSAGTEDIVFKYVGRSIAGRFTGNIWDVHIEDSTGVLFSNFLAQDSADMEMLSEIGPDVQFVNGTYPIVEKSVEYGHEWSNYSVVADDSKIPADPTSPGKDVLGDDLTNPGTPQMNMDVTGYTGAWEGVASATLGSSVSLISDFKFVSGFTITDSAATSCFCGGDDHTQDICIDSSAVVRIVLNGTEYKLTTLIVSQDVKYKLTLERNATTLTGTLLNISAGTSVVEAMTVTGDTSTGINRLAAYGLVGAAAEFEGVIEYIQLYDSSDALTNHWVFESSPTSLQDTIYDIVGGNHGTIVNATLPFFTTEMDGSKLLKDGFDEAGGSDGLVPARADGLSATGEPLTNDAGQIEGSPVYLNAPLSVSFFEADEDNLVFYDALGVPKDVTPDDLVAWTKNYSDQYFFDDYKNLLIYSEDIEGACLEKTEDFVGK